jgi:hypothetical protein
MPFATITRADGTVQVTYNHMPLYYFAGDSAAGDTKGQGTLGVWFVAPVSGTVTASTAPATQAPARQRAGRVLTHRGTNPPATTPAGTHPNPPAAPSRRHSSPYPSRTGDTVRTTGDNSGRTDLNGSGPIGGAGRCSTPQWEVESLVDGFPPGDAPDARFADGRPIALCRSAT